MLTLPSSQWNAIHCNVSTVSDPGSALCSKVINRHLPVAKQLSFYKLSVVLSNAAHALWVVLFPLDCTAQAHKGAANREKEGKFRIVAETNWKRHSEIDKTVELRSQPV